MPTYDYACKKCGHDFEVFHGMTEEPKVKCPACRSVRTRKQLGAGAGLLFKGSGFYTTDYRSQGYQAAAKAESAKPASGKKDAGGNGSKPASAPAPSTSSASAKTAVKS